MKTHEENINRYLSLGGDPKFVKKYLLPTIGNRAKIIYFLKKIASTPVLIDKTLDEPSSEKIKETSPTKTEIVTKIEPSKPNFLGFISQYPTELHATFKDCYNAWLDVCAYKVELNAVPENETDKAYDVQWKIHNAITNFDHFKKALDHWNEHKRLLPTESKTDFSKYSLFELDQAKRSIATLISRRKKTIAKKEKELPPVDAIDYRKKLAAIQRKKEQLEEMLLDEIKIEKLLKSSKSV